VELQQQRRQPRVASTTMDTRSPSVQSLSPAMKGVGKGASRGRLLSVEQPRGRRARAQWEATPAVPELQQLQPPQPRRRVVVQPSDNESLRRQVLQLRERLNSPTPASMENMRLRQQLEQLRNHVAAQRPPSTPPPPVAPVAMVAPTGTAAAATAPPPPNKQRALALAIGDWAADGPGDVSLRRGDQIVVVHVDESGWWRGVTPRGEEGVFPKNYVRMLSTTSRGVRRTPKSSSSASASSLRPTSSLQKSQGARAEAAAAPPSELSEKMGELNDVFAKMNASLASMARDRGDGASSAREMDAVETAGKYAHYALAPRSPLSSPWAESVPARVESPPRTSYESSVAATQGVIDRLADSPQWTSASAAEAEPLFMSDVLASSSSSTPSTALASTASSLRPSDRRSAESRFVSSTVRELERRQALVANGSWQSPTGDTTRVATRGGGGMLLPTTVEMSSQEPGSMSDVVTKLLEKSLPQRMAFQQAVALNGLTPEMLEVALSLEADTGGVEGVVTKPGFLMCIQKAVNSFGTPQPKESNCERNFMALLRITFDALAARGPSATATTETATTGTAAAAATTRARTSASVVSCVDIMCALSQFIVDGPEQMCLRVFQALCSQPSAERFTKYRMTRGRFASYAGAVFAVAFACAEDVRERMSPALSALAQNAVVAAACDAIFGEAPRGELRMDEIVSDERSNDRSFDEFMQFYVNWHRPGSPSTVVWVELEAAIRVSAPPSRRALEDFVAERLSPIMLLRAATIAADTHPDGAVTRAAFRSALVRAAHIAPDDDASRQSIHDLFDLLEEASGGETVELRFAIAALSIFCTRDLETVCNYVFKTHATSAARRAVRAEPVMQRPRFVEFLRAIFAVAEQFPEGITEFSPHVLASTLADRYFATIRGAQAPFVSRQRFTKVFFELTTKKAVS
jgi:hypothetical protein